MYSLWIRKICQINMPLKLTNLCITAILLCYFAKYSISSKILVHGDSGGGSHYFLLERIAEALAQRGHNVTVYVSDMYGYKRDSNLLKFVVYKSLVTLEEWEGLYSKVTASYMSGEGFLSQIQSQRKSAPFVLKLMLDQCHSALNNKQLLQTMKSEHFDILIGDFYFICASLVGQALGIKYVLVSNPLPASWHHNLNRNPVNPSYIPAVMSGFDSYMSFSTRLLNTIQIAFDTIEGLSVLTNYDNLKKTHNIKPDISTYRTLQQAELWFINTHFALDFARPLLPNSILVGGITTGPANALDSVRVFHFVHFVCGNVTLIHYSNHSLFCSAVCTLPPPYLYS